MRNKLVALLAMLAACLSAAQAHAANLLVNGGFETTSFFYLDGGGNPVYPGTSWGPYFPDQTVQGWDNAGYNFIFTPDLAASASGSPSTPAYLQLWGMPGTGVSNGITASPVGGNFVAADGAYLNAPLSQTVTGLTVGQQYAVTFWWAAGQQYGINFNGDTASGWNICFGTCAYTTSYDANGDGYATFTGVDSQIVGTGMVSVPEHGFVPWRYEYLTFTATSSTQTLSLLAYGTPLGQPPFALIDGIGLQAVPEPTTWAMMLVGFGLIGGVMRGRRQSPLRQNPAHAQIV